MMRPLCVALISLPLAFCTAPPGPPQQALPREPAGPPRLQAGPPVPLPAGAVARLGGPRFYGAAESALQVALAPDGKTLAAAVGADVVLCDVDSGKEIRRLPGAGDDVTSLAWSPCGRILGASRGEEGESCIWDATTYKTIRKLRGWRLSFSPDGHTAVTADRWKVLLWEVSSGRLLRDVRVWGPAEHLAALVGGRVAVDHPPSNGFSIWNAAAKEEPEGWCASDSWLVALAASADGKMIASTHGDGSLCLWDAATRKLRHRWRGEGSGNPIAVAPEGNRVAVVLGGRVHLWDPGGAAPRAIGAKAMRFRSLTFSADGKLLAAGTGASLRLFDVASGRDLRAAGGHRDAIEQLAFPARDTLVTASADCTLVWTLPAAKERWRLAHRGPPDRTFLALAPDGATAVLVDGAGKIDVFDPLRGARRGELAGPRAALSAAFSPDGRFVAVQSRRGPVRLHDAITCQQTVEISCDPGRVFRQEYYAPTVSRGGKFLMAWVMYGVTELIPIRLEHPGGRALPRSPRNPSGPGDLAFSPCGRRAAEDDHSRLLVWDLLERKQIASLQRPEWASSAGFFSPDGELLATWGQPWHEGKEGQPPAVHDLSLGVWLPHFGPGQASIRRPVFSADGRTLLTCTKDGALRLWEVATGRLRREFAAPPEGPYSRAVFSPDGRLLATAHGPVALVWDVTGRCPDGLWREAALTPERLQSCWEALAGEDAGRAHAAIWELVAAPGQAVPWLRRQLRPEGSPDAARIAGLLEKLNSPRWAEREEATHALERLGESAVPAVRAALAGALPLEARRRLERLQACLPVLRSLRAQEVLEQIGTAEARQVLQEVVGVAPDSRLTRAAAAALRRLGSL